MIAGVSTVQVTTPSQLAANVVTTTAIAPGAIENDDINALAAIAFSKLNSGAVDTDLIPDSDDTRKLGMSSKWFHYIYGNYLAFSYFTHTIKPSANGIQDIGDDTHRIKTIYANELAGDCLGQIMVFGIMG